VYAVTPPTHRTTPLLFIGKFVVKMQLDVNRTSTIKMPLIRQLMSKKELYELAYLANQTKVRLSQVLQVKHSMRRLSSSSTRRSSSYSTRRSPSEGSPKVGSVSGSLKTNGRLVVQHSLSLKMEQEESSSRRLSLEQSVSERSLSHSMKISGRLAVERALAR